MLPSEALQHERGKRHRDIRRKSARLGLETGKRARSKESKDWGGHAGLEALENRKFEGSLGTMQSRVTSWMRGLELAAAGDPEENERGWKMEEDYQVEEYPPLEEWSTGWAETWALSSTDSGSVNGSCDPDADTRQQGWSERS